MAKHIYVVFTDPVDGQEKEYNDWYDNVHLNDVLSIPGFEAAQRFKVSQSPSPLPGTYLAIYEMNTDDPAPVLAALQKAAESGTMKISAALNAPKAVTAVFTPIGARVAR